MYYRISTTREMYVFFKILFREIIFLFFFYCFKSLIVTPIICAIQRLGYTRKWLYKSSSLSISISTFITEVRHIVLPSSSSLKSSHMWITQKNKKSRKPLAWLRLIKVSYRKFHTTVQIDQHLQRITHKYMKYQIDTFGYIDEKLEWGLIIIYLNLPI